MLMQFIKDATDNGVKNVMDLDNLICDIQKARSKNKIGVSNENIGSIDGFINR